MTASPSLLPSASPALASPAPATTPVPPHAHPSASVFPFERKVERWACSLSRSMMGAPAPFVLTFRADGSAHALSFDHPATSWFAHARSLADAGTPHLFYDPLDGDGRAFIAWLGLERATLERLLGAMLGDGDFVDGRGGERQAYPAEWDTVLDGDDGG